LKRGPIDFPQRSGVLNLEIEENLSGGDSRTETTARWVLQELKPGDLTKLTTRPLKEVDLPAWNTTVAHMDAPTIFAKGLENLEKILQKAEKEICGLEDGSGSFLDCTP
jgi:hypothetical protein